MASISSLGVGSGLDLNGLLDRLIAAEFVPAANRLNLKEANHQAELSAFGTLKGSLSSFQGAISSLSTISTFQASTATSGDADVFTASASGSAANGTYTVEVETLAQAHKVALGAVSDDTASIGTGTLTFRLGTYDSGLNQFTPNSAVATQTVTIDSAQDSLQGIRDAVNEADIGISASVINDGAGYRLVFTSSDTGEDYSIKLTVTDDDSNHTDTSGLSQIAYDPEAVVGSGKNLSETVAAQDATFYVDGITVTSSTNIVTDTIEGVTLTLLSENPGTDIALAVTEDQASVTDAVNTFIAEYNTLTGVISDLTSYDADTQQAGILIGDFTLLSIERQLRNILSTSIDELEAPYTNLVNIGITTRSDGNLVLDSAALQEALDADFNAVGKLFAAAGSASDSLIDYAGFTDATTAGDYDVQIDSFTAAIPATQGIYTGAVAGSLTIDANNDDFHITIDGTASGAIALTQQTYGTGAALAAEIQGKINADAALVSAGVSVTVTYDTDHYVITSDSSGSDSTVTFTSVDTNTVVDLGLSVASGTAGTDFVDAVVTGKIDGIIATASGPFLTALGAAEGLRIEVLGGATGARGTVTFSRGIAYRLDTLLTSLLATTGNIESRTGILGNQVDDINDERGDLELRRAAREDQLREQFSILDGLLAQLNATSSFLTQQLDALARITLNSNS